MSAFQLSRPRLVGVVLLIVAVLGGLIFMLSSRKPAAPAAASLRPISLTSTVRGSGDAPAVGDQMSIRTDLQRTHEFATEQFVASGSQVVTAAAAIGDVILINHTSSTIRVPSGATVTSDSGQSFLTTQSTLATPRGTCETPETCVHTPVRAAQVGAAGNLPAHAISQVAGFAASVLSADHPLPITAGRDLQPVAVVTQQDYDAALAGGKADLEEALRQSAQSHLRQQPVGRTALPETEVLTITETVNHVPGDLAPALKVDVEVRGTITTISLDDLQEVLRGALSRQAPAHSHLVVGPVHVDYRVQAPAGADGHVVLDTTASGFTVVALAMRVLPTWAQGGSDVG